MNDNAFERVRGGLRFEQSENKLAACLGRRLVAEQAPVDDESERLYLTIFPQAVSQHKVKSRICTSQLKKTIM